jgi:endoglycosylceramidase
MNILPGFSVSSSFRRWYRAAGVVGGAVVVAAGLAGCAPEPLPPSLRAEGGRLLDERGREVMLHGINARVEGIFDVTFDDGRLPLEEIPAFSKDDLRFLRDELGMNALRLPINWSGLEPDEAGVIDTAYLARVDDVLDSCAELRIWCLVDLHQDAYSKEIGEDGAPLWAIKPPPTELLGGPLTNLEERRLSAQVFAAFDTFFSGAEGVQDNFLDLLVRLATHLKDRPYVMGIEVFNEPIGDSLPILAFAQRSIEAIHDVDPDRLVVWEPNSLRNLQDTTPTDGGLQQGNDAYAPHLYPEVFSGRRDLWESRDPTRLVLTCDNARAEADEHDAPLVVTEFGNAPQFDHGLAWIDRMQHEMDRVRASRFFWVYEEISQGEWGLFDAGHVLREPLVDVLARPTADAIAGAIDSVVVDEDDTLRVTFTGGGEHAVRLPARGFADGAAATCDGDDVEVFDDIAVPGRVVVVCGTPGAKDEHTLVVRPR